MPADAPLRICVLTLDAHLSAVLAAAGREVAAERPGLTLSVHVASRWANDPGAAAQAVAEIGRADIVVAHMLFLEDHYAPVIEALRARRAEAKAVLACLSAGEVVRLTRLGGFDMGAEGGTVVQLLKRLRGRAKGPETAGARQMAMLRRLPKILRFVPGTAQDMRAYFLAMGFLLAGSVENMAGLLRLLVSRYGGGGAEPAAPIAYPDVGVYHPRLPGRIDTDATMLPRHADARGRVGLVLMRSYVLSGDTGHYDGAIAALEAQGLDVVPVFASGLDARPAVDAYLRCVDAIVSLTGFSLVGGPAYNDAEAAAALLAELDVPYVAAHATEFQTIDGWHASERGLTPVETVMSLAIPELDGACLPMTIGAREREGGAMVADPERVAMLAARVARLVALRHTPAAERRIAITLFAFPPNAGAIGTAAHLSVFRSLWHVLRDLAANGYTVDLPESEAAMTATILAGNAERYGTTANVFARVPCADHIRREPHLREIERQWGAAPGRHQSDGRDILLTGARFGNILVGVQPAMGYEGDPMRLLFERGHAPTHAFAAYYRHLREDFGAHALLHFGTHGALEFMPGKQAGLTGACWPERLIGAMPHLYLYAANNPSEAALAKRRSGAVTISHRTPPLARAGLYRGLAELRETLARWADPAHRDEALAALIAAQAAALDLAGDPDALHVALAELEATLVPHGLHVVGEAMDADAARDLSEAMADAQGGDPAAHLARLLQETELAAIRHALAGGYVAPVPGGDILTTPAVLPTGRNVCGFDPFRLPSAWAMTDGAAQAGRLVARHRAATGADPRSVAIVLWGTDTLKSGGAPIAQALALIGARPRFDGFGRLAGAALIPLAELGRARIDVVASISGIFRDLLPLQVKLIAEAAWLAATADEPVELNAVRARALAEIAAGADPEQAALRVFSNAEGAYGANVNHLIEAGLWDGEDEIADLFATRKGFAYARDGRSTPAPHLLERLLGHADLAYQNLESVELGVTSLDQYVDSLGGMARAAQRRREGPMPVYVGDQTGRTATVRTMAEQVALETRTRALNPRWQDAMLAHGQEGVRHIEASITNTVGWSATTGQVQPWVYQRLTESFILDEAMRRRLAALNPHASARMAHRLLEAEARAYWTPDAATLAALRAAGHELDDQMEGIAA